MNKARLIIWPVSKLGEGLLVALLLLAMLPALLYLLPGLPGLSVNELVEFVINALCGLAPVYLATCLIRIPLVYLGWVKPPRTDAEQAVLP